MYPAITTIAIIATTYWVMMPYIIEYVTSQPNNGDTSLADEGETIIPVPSLAETADLIDTLINR